MSTIFYPHATKMCCAGHGYKMLHVAQPLNTAANSIFAAFFEKIIRSSGASEVFDSNWEHFQQMTFLESTPETNSPLGTLDKSEITPPAPKKSKASQESDARAACILPSQRALINPLPHNQIQVNQSGENSLAEHVNLFGKTVADNLL